MTPKPDEAMLTRLKLADARRAVDRAKAGGEPTFEDQVSHVRALQINLEDSGQYDDAAALAAVLARLGEYEKDKERVDWLERQSVQFQYPTTKPWTAPDDSMLVGTYQWHGCFVGRASDGTKLRRAIDEAMPKELASRADIEGRK